MSNICKGEWCTPTPSALNPAAPIIAADIAVSVHERLSEISALFSAIRSSDESTAMRLAFIGEALTEDHSDNLVFELGELAGSVGQNFDDAGARILAYEEKLTGIKTQPEGCAEFTHPSGGYQKLRSHNYE
ncbi:hypothetical protein R0135_03360 [Congregibacter variabilis]|uniref:Uncharacterized protein n=1 Tax=Congregibacter variabilis TaxID=3081200 RepID=A0ABZ0I3W8_9GAMM|nr:hypothetical protein R0135_03360 [Congregibacter sp. IMCC43200]